MEGGTGLRSWEKAYWGVFVVAIALFLFNRLPGKEVEVEDLKVRLISCMQMRCSPASNACCGRQPLLRIALILCETQSSQPLSPMTQNTPTPHFLPRHTCVLFRLQIAEEREARKAAAARMVLAGASVVDGEGDLFDGLSPSEIQMYVEGVTGAKQDDPFEGMSPEEIDEYVKKHGVPPGA